jgi:hypothetical protein
MQIMTLPSQFVKSLTQALNRRQVARGVALLDGVADDLGALVPGQPDTAGLLLLLAQWVDVGYRDHRLLDSLLARFPLASRRKLPLDDYLRLRMVDGFRALSVADADRAVEIFDFVLRAEREAPDE